MENSNDPIETIIETIFLIFFAICLIPAIQGVIHRARKKKWKELSNEEFNTLDEKWQKKRKGEILDSPEQIERLLVETPDWRGQPKSLFSCTIAGLEYHLEDMVYGGFAGYSAPEPKNPYDVNAVAIYNIGGDLIGYVPRKAHEAYRSHFPDEVMTYVIGYIEVNDIGKFVSNAWLIRIHSFEYAKKELIRMSKVIKKKYGYDIDRLDEILEPIDRILEHDAQVGIENKEQVKESAKSQQV